MAHNASNKKAFTYSGVNSKGEKISGEIFALNKSLAIALLKKQGVRTPKVKAYSEPSQLLNILSGNHISSIDVSIFTRQLATMQNAGLPLVQALKVVTDVTQKKALAFLILQIKYEVESGNSLSASLKKHSLVFDDLYCNLIESGEQSGTLDVMLDRIALYKEKIETLKRKFKKAMYYPVTVVLVASVVTSILLIKVVPTFKNMFDSFGAELPYFTRIVLAVSDFLQKNGIFVLIGIIGSILLFIRSYKSSSILRERVQLSLLKVPVIGKIIHLSAIARFSRTLATTFAAGVPLTIALDSVAYATGNILYQKAILEVHQKVSNGEQLFSALQENKVFPNLIVQMVSIGEEAGKLDEMLHKCANIYEEEVDSLIDGMSTLIEPLIMVILGVIVGGLVIAMYLPIFKLGSVI